jgi:hypothetical protein
MRITMQVREVEGLRAKAQARTKRQKQRVLEATELNKRQEFDLVVDLANKDTQYMASHTQSESTYQGFGYRTGYHARDFIGHTNPVTGKVITSFYPVYVIHGTRFYAGNDFLGAARRTMRPIVRKRLANALSGR